MLRNDKTGRNTVETLKYYSGLYSLLNKGYRNLSVHEKITVRSAYCGVDHPGVVLQESINNQSV